MQQDRIKWDQRYAGKPSVPPGAPKTLLAEWSFLKSGTVLDIASGDGAASLFLAEKGFAVTAADISATGLNRLAGFAEDAGLAVKTCCVDLDDTAVLQQLGRFDNVVMSYFRPTPELLVALSGLLTPGGRIWLATFNQRQHQQQGFSARFCLGDAEFCDFSGQPQAGLTLLEYRSHNDDEGGIDSYLFEKDAE
ncbi:class I SAM-dependent methyltransferase [Aliamphritea spongicola]|uniref:class I SAM-dependent methyltransferase n=1 Tax=Aliamphritea spongicola TaxID=707589 RepID=UPI00196A620B|nr:class I SAM-dependent methyltransferase [Aliamphritea spongicola]MBN3561275.1 class I SAM-dependent methyltransferase [Aliamphritea spongicola]